MITGSNAFFKGLKGFKPHDIDYVYLVNKEDVSYEYLYQLSKPGISCTFIVVKRPKEELIDYAINHCPPMAIARFLTVEFAEAIGFIIEDLPKLKVMKDNLDDKHKYLGIIYDSYLENKSFTLTNEQRMKAFEDYKNSRLNLRN
jgi:hypothetical protein